MKKGPESAKPSASEEKKQPELSRGMGEFVPVPPKGPGAALARPAAAEAKAGTLEDQLKQIETEFPGLVQVQMRGSKENGDLRVGFIFPRGVAAVEHCEPRREDGGYERIEDLDDDFTLMLEGNTDSNNPTVEIRIPARDPEGRWFVIESVNKNLSSDFIRITFPARAIERRTNVGASPEWASEQGAERAARLMSQGVELRRVGVYLKLSDEDPDRRTFSIEFPERPQKIYHSLKPEDTRAKLWVDDEGRPLNISPMEFPIGDKELSESDTLADIRLNALENGQVEIILVQVDGTADFYTMFPPKGAEQRAAQELPQSFRDPAKIELMDSLGIQLITDSADPRLQELQSKDTKVVAVAQVPAGAIIWHPDGDQRTTEPIYVPVSADGKLEATDNQKGDVTSVAIGSSFNTYRFEKTPSDPVDAKQAEIESRTRGKLDYKQMVKLLTEMPYLEGLISFGLPGGKDGRESVVTLGDGVRASLQYSIPGQSLGSQPRWMTKEVESGKPFLLTRNLTGIEVEQAKPGEEIRILFRKSGDTQLEILTLSRSKG